MSQQGTRHLVGNFPSQGYDEHGQRRSSMQDAADAIMWETFHLPGATEQAMLPPQPSRNASLGLPLQLTDSNKSVPYVGKGKGRARDLEVNQQAPEASQNVVPQHQPSIGSFEPFHVPGIGFDGMASSSTNPLGLNDPLNNFDFIQDQMLPWQPLHPDYLQSSLVMDPMSEEFQISQANAHPHAHPPPVQKGQVGPVPPQQMQIQMPLQHSYQPPPGFPQQPQLPGQAIYPSNITQQEHQLQQMSTHDQQPPPPETSNNAQPSGYRFRPGIGFVCQVCGYSMRQPGIHRFEGQERWCWADGPDMQMDAAEETARRLKRGKRKPKIRMSYI